MGLRICPICMNPLIRRADQVTCGVSCAKEWRHLPPKTKLMKMARAEAGITGIPEDWKPLGGELNENVDDKAEKERLEARQSTVTMPQALKSILGVKPEDEVCKEHGKAMCFVCSGILKTE